MNSTISLENLKSALTQYKQNSDIEMESYLESLEVNAFKEISNPLTTTDISQESPIGSVISYMGDIVPDHYLLMDGSIYNINDYPALANHFLTIYGSYNIFGGDGLTTFAVPNRDRKNTNTIDLTPVMTNNTTPNNFVVSASSDYGSPYAPWKVFDGTSNTSKDSAWFTSSGNPTGWIMIKLDKPTSINSFSITSRNYSDSNIFSPKNFNFEGSNDGINFTVLKEVTNATWISNQTKQYSLNSVASYLYYRVNILTGNTSNMVAIGKIKLLLNCNEIECIKCEPTYYAVNQYGGFENKVLFEGKANSLNTDYQLTDSLENYDFLLVYADSIRVTPSVKTLLSPLNMTANDKPVPYVASASSNNGASYLPWNAFASSGNMWVTANKTITGWLQIDLSEPKAVNYFEITATIPTNMSLSSMPKDFTFEGSNDGVAFDILGSFADITGWVNSAAKQFSVINNTPYRYYRVNVTKNNGDTSFLAIRRLSLYHSTQELYNYIKESQMISIDEKTNDSFYTINQWNSDASHTSRVEFKFKNDNSFNISELYHKGYGGVYISKIIGIKGQIPTLLQGGTF